MSGDDETIRLLVVIRHPIGGITSYLRYTYTHLDSSKYRVTVLTPDDEHIETLRASFSNTLDVHVVTGKRVLVSLACTIAKAIWSRRFDLIHSQGATAGLFVAAANLITPVPHIITFHETFDTTMLKRKLQHLQLKIMSFLLSRVDALNFVSRDAKNNFLEYFPDLRQHASKMFIINNGLDTKHFLAATQFERDIRRIDGIDIDTFVIGFLGRFMPEKGFPVLIDALEILNNDNHLSRKPKVLALGWNAFIREYQADIRRKNLTDSFVFIEQQADVRWVLRQVDCVVIPSLREAFPLIALEALVSGTPIIASDCIGLREALRGTPALIFSTANATALAAAIRKSINEPQKPKAVAYVPEAVRRFDASKATKQLEHLFRKVSTRASASYK